MEVLLLGRDDEITNQLQNLLSKHQLFTCSTAVEARTLWSEHCYSFAIIDGRLDEALGLCREFRESSKGEDCFILFVTPPESTCHFSEVLNAGANDCIPNPIDDSLFQLRLAMAERLHINTIARLQVENDWLHYKSQTESVIRKKLRDLQVTNAQLLEELDEHRQAEAMLLQHSETLEESYSTLRNTKKLLDEAAQAAVITETFERFVPRQFLQRIDTDGIDAIQPGYISEEHLTFLFVDIREFTGISEGLQDTETFEFLNEYFSRVSPRITENHGFIDKFIGDGIMAVFDRESSAQDAVEAAIAVQQEVIQYNGTRLQKGLEPIRIGVGIHTGEAIMGILGGDAHLDSTVIGDSVNLASRVEALTKIYNANILITEATYQELNVSNYQIRQIDTVKVRGKDQATTIYEIFDADLPHILAQKYMTMDDLKEGIQCFKQQEFDRAVELFEQCHEIFPEDVVAKEYMKRCYYFSKYPPGDDWQGVVQETSYTTHSRLKRRAVRLPFHIPVNVYTKNDESHFAAHSADISPFGIMLEIASPLNVFDMIMLEFFFPQDSWDDFLKQEALLIMGNVVWKRKGETCQDGRIKWLIGVEFLLLSDREEEIIRKNLIRLAGLHVPENSPLDDLIK